MLLILFDIDGTLLLSQRAGVRAMEEAGRRLHGAHFSFDGVDFAGRLDPIIWATATAANGVPEEDYDHETFRALYAELLAPLLDEPGCAHLLPGVAKFVDALDRADDVTLGLLTGNYPETGQLKVSAAGLDPDRFPIGAWGSDGAHRRDLPPVAFERFAERYGADVAPERVVIIGDTPHDIDCAQHNGCRSIGVATGPGYSRQDLAGCGADLLVDDLRETSRLLEFLLSETVA